MRRAVAHPSILTLEMRAHASFARPVAHPPEARLGTFFFRHAFVKAELTIQHADVDGDAARRAPFARRPSSTATRL